MFDGLFEPERTRTNMCFSHCYCCIRAGTASTVRLHTTKVIICSELARAAGKGNSGQTAAQLSVHTTMLILRTFCEGFLVCRLERERPPTGTQSHTFQAKTKVSLLV